MPDVAVVRDRVDVAVPRHDVLVARRRSADQVVVRVEDVDPRAGVAGALEPVRARPDPVPGDGVEVPVLERETDAPAVDHEALHRAGAALKDESVEPVGREVLAAQLDQRDAREAALGRRVEHDRLSDGGQRERRRDLLSARSDREVDLVRAGVRVRLLDRCSQGARVLRRRARRDGQVLVAQVRIRVHDVARGGRGRRDRRADDRDEQRRAGRGRGPSPEVHRITQPRIGQSASKTLPFQAGEMAALAVAWRGAAPAPLLALLIALCVLPARRPAAAAPSKRTVHWSATGRPRRARSSAWSGFSAGRGVRTGRELTPALRSSPIRYRALGAGGSARGRAAARPSDRRRRGSRRLHGARGRAVLHGELLRALRDEHRRRAEPGVERRRRRFRTTCRTWPTSSSSRTRRETGPRRRGSAGGSP